jgi:membrane associated rhomboid family serine protease
MLNYIKKEFRNGTTVHRLLVVNLCVFAVIVLIKFIDWATNAGVERGWSSSVAGFLSISSDWKNVLWHIWSPITSMFLHQDFGHILFNMFGLMMFGNIVCDLIGNRRVLPIYLLGGLVGNLFFFISANLLYGGVEHLALGASGAIMALAGAAVAIAPDYRVQLMFFGAVSLKIIVLFMLLADLVGIADQINTGGHFAHLGGIAFGWFFMQRLNNGSDLSEKVNDFMDRVKGWFEWKSNRNTPSNTGSDTQNRPAREPAFRVTRGGRNPQRETRATRQETLDAILDKIRLQGMASLTAEEKQFLESLKDSE